MTTEPNPSHVSRGWFDMWRTVLLHPTVKSFSQIASDSKASTKWGVIWPAIAALMVWLVGPQRMYLWGRVADTFGLDAASLFIAIGTVVFPIVSVIALLSSAAMAHGLARLFNGAGTFRQLAFCWGVMQVPIILFSGLAFNIVPQAYYLYLSLSSSEINFPVLGLVFLIGTSFAAAAILYLFYGQVVAYSAIEKFRVRKGFGLIVLLGLVLGVVSAGISAGLQIIVMRSFGY